MVLEEVGVLVMPWRACRSALAVLKWSGGMLGGAEAELRYAVCTGGYPSTHNLSGDSTGRVHEILGKNELGLPSGEAGRTLGLARKRTGKSIERKEKNTSSFPFNRIGVRFQTNCRPHQDETL